MKISESLKAIEQIKNTTIYVHILTKLNDGL